MEEIRSGQIFTSAFPAAVIFRGSRNYAPAADHNGEQAHLAGVKARADELRRRQP